MKTSSQSLHRSLDAPTADRRSARSVVGDLLLTIAAVGGVLCIIGVLLALVFNITLIMFKTGSMSPSIPTGSLAVVREIAAADVRVGDITTIDRPGLLPITHRVIAVRALTGSLREISMQGDANAQPDAQPYVVSHVRLVVFSVPQLAYFVSKLANPFIMGGIAVGVAGLVTWAFWPGDNPAGGARGARSGRSLRRSRSRGRNRSRNRSRDRSDGRHPGSALVLCLVLAIVPLCVQISPAAAADSDTIVRGKFITLTSVANPDELNSLSPGRPTYWQVGIQSTAPNPGMIYIAMSAVGQLALPGGLDVSINACVARWIAETCASGATQWLAREPLANASLSQKNESGREIGVLTTGQPMWLMMTMILPTGTQPGAFARVQLHARGVGSDVVIGVPPTTALASTGASIAWPIVLAVFAVMAGLALAATARRIRARRSLQ